MVKLIMGRIYCKNIIEYKMILLEKHAIHLNNLLLIQFQSHFNDVQTV